MEKVLFGLMAYIPWLVWIIAFPIYKKIRRENVWESKVYTPVMWIFTVLGCILNPILLYFY
jgi:hypothetical protein